MTQKNVYFINLTREYPQALLPKPATVAAWFHQQSPVVTYMIPQRQKGIFKIQCKSNDDFKKLKKFKLAIKNAKGEQGRSICLELPREHKPRGREFYDGTFVTIIGACENGLEQEENSEFDKFFSQFGIVVKNTWNQTYRGNDQPNGKKSLVIQLNRGSAIPRQIDYVNERTKLKGKVRVYYKDQPYECSQCQTVHEGICPKRRAEKEREEEEKLDRELKTKTLIVSDSTLRRVDTTKTNADIVCIPGGKLGHLVNSMNYNEKILNYDNYVIVGGLNNIDRGEDKDVERTQIFKQLNDLGKGVREILGTDDKKKLYLVAPVKAPSKDPVKIGDITEMMKNMEINNRKQGNIKLIETKFSRCNDDIYEDDLHLNQIGTTRLMKELGKTIEGLLREDRVTSNYIYSRVATEYPWGCNFCCKEGHDEEQCDGNPRKRNSSHLSSPEGSSDKKKGRK